MACASRDDECLASSYMQFLAFKDKDHLTVDDLQQSVIGSLMLAQTLPRIK